MTLINRLIAQAKAGATVLEIPENHVRSVAEHMRLTGPWYPRPTHEECEAAIRAGTVTLRGVRMEVRVIARALTDTVEGEG